jgi:hypothetical protein
MKRKSTYETVDLMSDFDGNLVAIFDIGFWSRLPRKTFSLLAGHKTNAIYVSQGTTRVRHHIAMCSRGEEERTNESLDSQGT